MLSFIFHIFSTYLAPETPQWHTSLIEIYFYIWKWILIFFSVSHYIHLWLHAYFFVWYWLSFNLIWRTIKIQYTFSLHGDFQILKYCNVTKSDFQFNLSHFFPSKVYYVQISMHQYIQLWKHKMTVATSTDIVWQRAAWFSHEMEMPDILFFSAD